MSRKLDHSKKYLRPCARGWEHKDPWNTLLAHSHHEESYLSSDDNCFLGCGNYTDTTYGESHSNTGMVALLFYVLLWALLYVISTQKGTMCSSWNAPVCIGPSAFQTQRLLLGSVKSWGETSQHFSWSCGRSIWSSHLGSQQRELIALSCELLFTRGAAMSGRTAKAV